LNVIPIELVRKLKWKERQKLVVKKKVQRLLWRIGQDRGVEVIFGFTRSFCKKGMVFCDYVVYITALGILLLS